MSKINSMLNNIRILASETMINHMRMQTLSSKEKLIMLELIPQLFPSHKTKT